MKREAVGGTKMKRLCHKLNVRIYTAVGVLESLWHLTAREAPQGDIGKLANEDIALGIDWDGDADKLIDALVYAKWLDRVKGKHRLLVHDWHEHADDAVDLRLARAGLYYATGQVPRMKRLGKDEKARILAQYANAVRTEAHESALPVPEPLPEPVPEPVPGAEPLPPQAATAPPSPPALEPDEPYDFTADPAEHIPEGLPLLQYATFIREILFVSMDTATLRLLGDAIEMLSKSESCALNEATRRMLNRIRKRDESRPLRFWLNDDGWKEREEVRGSGANKGNRGAAVKRVERSVAAWGRAAVELRGTRDPDNSM